MKHGDLYDSIAVAPSLNVTERPPMDGTGNFWGQNAPDPKDQSAHHLTRSRSFPATQVDRSWDRRMHLFDSGPRIRPNTVKLGNQSAVEIYSRTVFLEQAKRSFAVTTVTRAYDMDIFHDNNIRTLPSSCIRCVS